MEKVLVAKIVSDITTNSLINDMIKKGING